VYTSVLASLESRAFLVDGMHPVYFPSFRPAVFQHVSAEKGDRSRKVLGALFQEAGRKVVRASSGVCVECF
jgi:hypothetical protein